MEAIKNLINSFLSLFVKQKYSEQVIIPQTEPAKEPAKIIPVNPQRKRFAEYSEKRKKLLNPWNSQRNNKYSPFAACNVTTVQVLLSLDYPNITDDDIFLLCNSQQVKNIIEKKYPVDFKTWIWKYFRDNCANEVYVCMIEAVKIIMQSELFVRMECGLTAEKVKKEIDAGYAVFVCGSFGFRGHIVAVIGYDDEKKVWIVNDPYGNKNTGYKNINGDSVEYSYDWMKIPGYINPTSILIHPDKRNPF